MRAGSALLLAAAAFGAGLLAGRFGAPAAEDASRAPSRESVAGSPPEAHEAVAPGLAPDAAAPARASDLREPGDAIESPDEDEPLRPGTDFAEWDGTEFARWYAIHRKAWDLPEFDERDLVRFGGRILALDRIPRRDLLIRLLRAFIEWDADLQRAGEENAAWADANRGAPKGDPGWTACRERLTAAHQRFFDLLHRELPYADYLILWTGIDSNVGLLGAELRPPSSAADAYARSVAIARSDYAFERWYGGYAPLLGFPERDEDFLDGFHRQIVKPLGRLPDPALMRALQEIYAPLHWRLTSGEEWEDSVRKLFAALDRVLAPLDYERIRHSHEWDRYPDLVAPPADR